MRVKLISYSQSVDNAQSLQDLVAYCARVSNPTNQENTSTNEKLIKYLIALEVLEVSSVSSSI